MHAANIHSKLEFSINTETIQWRTCGQLILPQNNLGSNISPTKSLAKSDTNERLSEKPANLF